MGLLKGSVMFMADLMKELSIDCKIDFICVSSYGSGTESNGRVNLVKDVSQPVEGMDVLIVEDIIDSGRTLRRYSVLSAIALVGIQQQGLR